MAGLGDCSAADALVVDDLESWIVAQSHEWTYEELSLDQMNALTGATRALDAEALASAVASAASAGYEIVPLVAAGRCYRLLRPTVDAPAGQALLVYDPAWEQNLVLEAPHAHEDHNTDAEAALLFVRLRAKALVLSGAHRCAVRASSGCLATGQCDTVNRIPALSDPSHSFQNAVSAMHLAFRNTPAVELQLHTNSHADVNGEAMVSNGTHYAIAGTPADAFFHALATPDVDVRWCNDPNGPPDGAFCGETNVQSLASNGAADACHGHPSSAGGPEQHHFIHLEQSNQRMCLPDAPAQSPPCVDTVDSWSERVAAALAEAVPAR